MSEFAELTLEQISVLITDVMVANGCDNANAAALADIMTRAERDGSHSHGLFRVPGYVKALRSGKVDGKAKPVITKRTPAIIHVDGRGCFAPLAQVVGLPVLAEATAEIGVAALVLEPGAVLDVPALKATLAESQVALRDKDKELEGTYRSLEGAAKERTSLRRQLRGLQDQLQAATGELSGLKLDLSQPFVIGGPEEVLTRLPVALAVDQQFAIEIGARKTGIGHPGAKRPAFLCGEAGNRAHGKVVRVQLRDGQVEPEAVERILGLGVDGRALKAAAMEIAEFDIALQGLRQPVVGAALGMGHTIVSEGGLQSFDRRDPIGRVDLRRAAAHQPRHGGIGAKGRDRHALVQRQQIAFVLQEHRALRA